MDDFLLKTWEMWTIKIHKHTHSSHTHSLTQSHNRHDRQKSGAVETKMAEWHTRTASPLIRERPAQRLLAVRELGKMPSTTTRGARPIRSLRYVCIQQAVQQTAVWSNKNPLRPMFLSLVRGVCMCSFLFTDDWGWLLLASTTTISTLYFIIFLLFTSQANLN